MRKMRGQPIETDQWPSGVSLPLEDAPGSRLPGERRPVPELVPVTPNLLVRSIERDVIPRLVLAMRAGPVAQRPHPAALPTAQDVLDVSALAMAGDTDAGYARVEALQLAGAATETLFLELLAPVARHLGQLWEDDLCDFTQVTIGLMSLQQIMRRLSPAFQSDATHRALGCRVLLTPAPGEQHTFGLNMVAEFFRRAGWEVQGCPGGSVNAPTLASARELTRIVRTGWFAVVGFSLGSETHIDDLARAIRLVRKASCNPRINIMVGGPIFIQQPDLMARVGADATAMDGREAVLQAHRLLALLPDPA